MITVSTMKHLRAFTIEMSNFEYLIRSHVYTALFLWIFFRDVYTVLIYNFLNNNTY